MTSKVWKMEDDLFFGKMEDDLSWYILKLIWSQQKNSQFWPLCTKFCIIKDIFTKRLIKIKIKIKMH
jgi:hypothetical protein